MMKTVATMLFVTLLLPNTLFAATSDEVQPPPASESRPETGPPNVDQDTAYFPTAKNTYLGTGFGTLLVGGAFLALGAAASNSDGMGSQETGTGLYFIGGTFLAASSVLWILYFREKGKEPATTVGLELDKGKGAVLAKFKF
jgi:hypothetical protein